VALVENIPIPLGLSFILFCKEKTKKLNFFFISMEEFQMDRELPLQKGETPEFVLG